MLKYLLVVFVIVLVAWLIGSRRRKRDAAAPSAGAPAAKTSGASMIACVHCGLHLPEQEALRDAAGRAFCGEEHRRLGGG